MCCTYRRNTQRPPAVTNEGSPNTILDGFSGSSSKTVEATKEYLPNHQTNNSSGLSAQRQPVAHPLLPLLLPAHRSSSAVPTSNHRLVENAPPREHTRQSSCSRLARPRTCLVGGSERLMTTGSLAKASSNPSYRSLPIIFLVAASSHPCLTYSELFRI